MDITQLRQQFATLSRGEASPLYADAHMVPGFRDFLDVTYGTTRSWGPSWNPEWYDAVSAFLAANPEAPAESETRTSQHEAIIVMRRREHEARERAEREGQRADHLQAQLQTLRSRLAEFREALLQESIDRDWCSEYDEFIEGWEDLGFEPRFIDHDVRVTVTLTFPYSVSAPATIDDSYELRSYIDSSDVHEEIRNGDLVLMIDSWDVEA